MERRMTDPLFERDDAATPITPDERADLIPGYITTRAELNEAEQANITKATVWALARNRDVLDEDVLRNLHKRMLGEVWRWAGTFRQSERNIGVPHLYIGVELRSLLDDVRYWIAHETFATDEMATRFHHRLVLIHPFPNGNGRHARLITDLLLKSQGAAPFTWGRINLVDASETRKAYVAALRAADRHDLAPLLAFVRS